jgi:virginiamycin B lyase
MRAALVAVVAAFAATAPSHAQPVSIDEWEVPYAESRPRDPYVAPDGRVWFCGQRTGYLAVLDPATGEFRKYDLGEGAGPHNLIVDDRGMVWYAGNRRAHIGRLDPATGDVTQYPMPDEAARDPHTLAWDGKGDIWFTVQGGNFVGHLDTGSGEVRLVAVPSERARPYGIRVDPEGRPWIALFGTHKLATVDPATMELTEVPLSRESARPRRVEISSDGRVWYVDYADGMLGAYDPKGGSIEEWAIPGGSDSRPYGTALDDRDRLWFVETGPQPNRFTGFDTRAATWIGGTPIESGAGSVRHMYFHPSTRTIWFGTDANTIGRARLTDDAGR